jgi:histidinol-phosphate phosphatase family protein
MMKYGKPGILLDRDGVIIHDHGFVGSIDRVHFIPGAAAAIFSLNRAGIPVAVVSNQEGVARGLYGLDDVERVNAYIQEELAKTDAHIDMWAYCPYHPYGVVPAFTRYSDDFKPSAGMAKAVARSLNLTLPSSWVVGDRRSDVGMAMAVGAKAVYVGPDPEEFNGMHGVYTCADLAAAAPFILNRIR